MVPDGGNWIVEFLEKVTGAKSNLASMGVYVFNFRVLEEELAAVVGERKGFDFGKDVIPGMLGRRRLLCHPFRGYWRDVGTIKSYLEANMDCLNPDSGLALHVWQIRTAAEEIRLGDRLPARVTGDGAVVNSLVSPGCVVEGTVTNSVLSAGVRVARGASVRDSVVLQDTMLGPDSLTTYAILDKNCVVGKGAAVGLGPAAAPNRLNPSHLDCGITVVGKGALIPAGARIGRNSIIHPGVDLAAAGLVNVPGSSTVLENGETK
jgi:glucose-1-phosphate adenylyltransferase